MTGGVGESDINHSGETAVNVRAKSDVADIYEQYSVDAAGAGGGVGVTVSVTNTESDVKATMKGVKLGAADQYAPENVYANRSAKSVSVEAENNIAVAQSNWAAGAGIVGGGVGVGVNVANVDGTAEAAVTDSAVYSVSDVTVDAKENREATFFNGNTAAGAGAVGANVSVVTVGQEIDEASYQASYDWKDADGATQTKTVRAKDDAGAEISAAYDKAQNVIEDGELLSTQAFGYAGIDSKQDVTLSRGGAESAAAAGVQGTTVLTGGNIKVAGTETTDVNIDQYGFAAGIGSCSGTKAVMVTV